jgi:hypothetical protein
MRSALPETAMHAPATPDHDQRLKVLLQEFFEQFFPGSFPDYAARFDFRSCGERS